MKTLHIDNYQLNKENTDLFEEITNVLNKDEWNVEVYQLNLYDDKLPDDCTIVDYGSHETLAIIRNGEVLDEEDMKMEDDVNSILCNIDIDEEFVRNHYYDEDIQSALSDYDWDKVFELLTEKEGK